MNRLVWNSGLRIQEQSGKEHMYNAAIYTASEWTSTQQYELAATLANALIS